MTTPPKTSVRTSWVVWSLFAVFPLIIAVITYVGREVISLARAGGMDTWFVTLRSVFVLSLLTIFLVKWAFFTEPYDRRLDQDMDAAIEGAGITRQRCTDSCSREEARKEIHGG